MPVLLSRRRRRRRSVVSSAAALLLASAASLLLLTWPSSLAAEVDEIGAAQFLLDHSTNAGLSFLPRAAVTISTTGRSAVLETRLQETPESTADDMRRLCDDGGMYILRIRSTTGGSGGGGGDGDGPPQAPLRTAADPCRLLDSDLSDVLTMHLDWKNRLIAMSLTPINDHILGSPQGGSRSQRSPANITPTFATKVVVLQAEAGPQPDTSAFIQKLEQDKARQKAGVTEDNRSFLAKYWMYIVPMVIIMAMSSGGGGGTGGGG